MLVRDNELYFSFYERIIGSEFLLRFFTNFSYDISDNWTIEKTEFYVRDIPVKDSTIQYHRLSFSKLYWNFMSPDSDKILSLTREKFIRKKKIELQNTFLNEIVPKAIELAEKTLLLNIEEVKEIFAQDTTALSYGYFKLLLTKKINQLNGGSIKKDILGEVTLHNDLVEKLSGEAVKMKEFFSFDEVIIPVYSRNNPFQPSVRERKKDLVTKTFKSKKNEVLLIWNRSFFEQYILQNYNIQEAYFYEDGNILFLDRTTESINIKQGYKIYLRRLIKTPGLLKRGWYYSNKKFDRELSIENRYASGFEYFPYSSNRSIISPFKDENEYRQLINKIGQQDLSFALSEEVLREYISESLIDWVKKYRPTEFPERTDKMILDAYKRLIIDFIKNDI